MGRNSSFHVPEDLLLDLFPRLPIKTLARFKCIAKQWKDLISKQIPATNPKLLVFSHEPDKDFKFYSIDHETHAQSVSSPVEENFLRKKLLTSSEHFQIRSSLNGLLLVQIGGDLLMWNPLTIFFRKVHTYPDLVYPEVDQYFLIELCYDFVNNIYKVVLVDKYVGDLYSPESIYVGICGSSSWAKLDVPCHIQNFASGPFFKGHRYWICRRYTDWEGYSHQPYNIVYFDPQNNEFIEVPAPQRRKGLIDTLIGLGVLDGCLCATRCDTPGYNEGNIDFLMMKEDSWSIMFSIPYIPEFRYYNCMKPLLRTKKCEILVSMLTCHRHSIKAYDADGNFLRDVLDSPTIVRKYRNPYLHHSYFSVTFYEESWCSPTGYEWEIFQPKNIDSLSTTSVISGKGISLRSKNININGYLIIELPKLENSTNDLLELENSIHDLPRLQGLIKEDHHSKRKKKNKVFARKKEGSKNKPNHQDRKKKKGKERNYEIKESISVPF